MEHCLGDLRDDICLPYLDDVIVFGGSVEDNVEHLRRVLQRLRENGIKLKPSKCRFFKQQVKFPGRIVSEKGYCMDPDNTKAVTSLADKTPSTVGDVRKLVGLLGYYCCFIPKFSVIAKPLYDLLTTPTRPTANLSCNPVFGQLNSSSKVTWKKEHQAALEELLHYLTTPPLLACPYPNLPYILHTDARQDGLGAVLYQKQNNQLCVIAYASRTLTSAEQNYYMHSGKLEFLALKWAISDHFRDYLYYSPPFVAYTDNNPLTYVLTLIITSVASYLDLLFTQDRSNNITTKLYDKRDAFGFHIVNFPFMSSNIPSAPVYGVYASQLVRYARCCSSYSDFLIRHRALVKRLLSQGYKVDRLSNTFKKFYGRHTDLVGQ